MYKDCSGCKKEKPITEFYKQKTGKLGVLSYCISCSNQYGKKYRQENIEKRLEYDKKWRKAHPEYKKNYYKKNRKVLLEKRKKYYQEHYKEHYEYCKKYRQENSEYLNQYLKERRKNDPTYKLRINLRNRIKKAMKGITKSKRTEEILGCNFEKAKLWIEAQFKEGMTWNNHGLVWEIDHIVPLSIAQNEQKLYELSNYKNLQPLFWQDNRKKYNKYVERIS